MNIIKRIPHVTPLGAIQGCLMGVAIGDALGMPVETMKHEDIMLLNGGLGVTGFMPVVQKRIWDTATLKPGDTTDDWQLTRVVARSLIRKRGVVDLADCAEEHVRELGRSAFGWGKGTQNAIEAIRDKKRRPDEPLPPPAEGQGCGNGVIMKIAPLAIASMTNGNEELLRAVNEPWQQCRRLGSLTHPDVRASIAAYTVMLLMQCMFRSPRDIIDGFYFEWMLKNFIIPKVKCIEHSELVTTDLVSERIERIYTPRNPSAEELRKRTGCSFNALDTVAFTLGTLIRHPADFRAGVLEAVNAGGDSDTNASIVGALIGINVGLEGIPREWREFSPLFAEALTLGEQLSSLE